MIRINLLPHRALKRKALQRQFFVIAAVVAFIGVGVWFIVHSMLVGRIENQIERNKFLEEKIVELDKQIEEIKKLREQTAQLLARKKVVESLQANRAEAVHLLDELVRQLPDGVYLKGVKQSGQRVAISGYAQSNARISTLMRNLESSPWLEQASLVEIKTALQNQQRLSEFQLTVDLVRAKAEEAGKPAAKSAPVKTSSLATPAPENNTSPAIRLGPAFGG
ncbi:MAG: PilN domain-containing protein [Burkholderiales bacterium]|nr:PilN domain-containing protein [Burkholderiales bacterium]